MSAPGGAAPAARGYRVPAGPGQAERKEKGSRFLALLVPVAGPEEAARALDAIRRRFPDATHHCWAWRLGPEVQERSSDAGEPAGTAGVPILQALRGASLSDALCVVVRWFGGTKLGKGGLARAYAAAAREALAGLPLGERVPTVELALDLPYEKLGTLRRLLGRPEVRVLGERYGDRAALHLAVEAQAVAGLEEALASLGVTAAPLSPPATSDRVLSNRPSAPAGPSAGRVPRARRERP